MKKAFSYDIKERIAVISRPMRRRTSSGAYSR